MCSWGSKPESGTSEIRQVDPQILLGQPSCQSKLNRLRALPIKENISKGVNASGVLWILLSAWLVASGWGLSAIKELNAVGYVVALAIFALLIGALSRNRLVAFRPPRAVRLRRRFARPLPLIFLLCLAGAFVGGAIYPPTNYDAITYRIPRVLHWLNEGHWHWIPAWNDRMNYSATGFEWLMAPLFAIFRTDRFFFLINVVSYALLPGLLYSAFTLLGISRRVAWAWMWLLPTGYCFVTQAGSIGNDTFAAVYFLAALVFGMCGWRNGSMFCVGLCMLAAGLLTGAKASNIPLLLPIAVVLVPGVWKIVMCGGGRRPRGESREPSPILAPSASGISTPASARSPRHSPLATRPVLRFSLLLFAVLAALAVSFVPLAFINIRHTGDWSGDPGNTGKMKLTDPVSGVVGNGLQLAVGCMAPPVFPIPGAWNQLARQIVESPGLTRIHKGFPRLSLSLVELPSEEGAGLGFGLSVLLVVSATGGILLRPRGIQSPLAMLVGLCCWVALGAYMLKLGSECTARLVAAYYPGIIIPILALAPQVRLVTRRCWKILAVIAALSALIPLALAASRPLLPVDSMVGLASKAGLLSSITKRAQTVYSVYGGRNDNLAVVREHLPTSARTIGFAGTGDESELSFWRPFGQRQVIDLRPLNGRIPLVTRLDCVVGSEWGFNDRFGLTAQQFAEKIAWQIYWSDTIPTRAGSPPLRWFVVIPCETRQSADFR
jgi:hypothetical protein